MSTGVFYPYPTVPEGIALEVDVPDLEVPRGQDGTLLLYEIEREMFDVRASVLVLDGTGEALQERATDPELWLIARNKEGRYREGWKLSSTDLVEKTFQWSTREVRGTLELRAALLASGAGQHPRGTELAWSTPKKIHFTEPRTPPGHNLRITWRDFQHEEALEHLATELFTVSQTGLSDEPEIYLNSGVEGLHDVLMSKGRHGARARIRDSIFVQVVHQVWTSVLAGVMQDVHARFAQEEEIDAGEVLENLEMWQAGVLRSWSTELAYGKDRDEAVGRLLEDVCGPAGLRVVADLVVNHIPDAIQQRFNTRKAFDGLMKDAGLFQ